MTSFSPPNNRIGAEIARIREIFLDADKVFKELDRDLQSFVILFRKLLEEHGERTMMSPRNRIKLTQLEVALYGA